MGYQSSDCPTPAELIAHDKTGMQDGAAYCFAICS